MVTPVTDHPPTPRRRGRIALGIAGCGCLAVVAAAIAFLTLAVRYHRLVDQVESAELANRKSQVQTLLDLERYSDALEQHKELTGEYPLTQQAGNILSNAGPENWPYDGWRNGFRYYCKQTARSPCEAYVLMSAGRDGAFEHKDPFQLAPGPYPPHEFDRDIVVNSGRLIYWPEIP